MDTLQCAVVLAKLDQFDWEVERRIELGRRYNELVDGAKIRRSLQKDDRSSVFAQYTIFCDQREVGKQRLADAGIPTAVHYPKPLNQQPAYSHFCCPECTPVSARVSQAVLSLPMHPYMTDSDQDVIVKCLVGGD